MTVLGRVGPDADVVLLEPEPHAIPERQRLDVLERGQVRQQVPIGLLPDDPGDPAAVAGALAAAHLAQVVAGNDRPASRWRVEAAEDVQQGRLAAARGADDRDDFAAVDEQVQPLQRDHLEVGDLVDPDEVVADDERARAVAGPAGGARGAFDGFCGGHSNPRLRAATGLALRPTSMPSTSPRSRTITSPATVTANNPTSIGGPSAASA